ncbi:MAG: AMP-binding protein [Syntrophales bacterium]|nr:AMP-binding protein [Syntrophales bacterium]
MNSDFTLYDLIARRADLTPAGEALVDGTCRTTFRELLYYCDQFSGALMGRGIASGERIAILSGNSLEFVALLGAIARVDAVAVLLNTRLHAEEIASILDDTKPRLLISDTQNLALTQQSVSTLGSFLTCVLIEDMARDKQAPLSPLPSSSAAAKPFLIIPTAAVGGKPRGAILSHGNLLSCALQTAQLLALEENDTYLGLLPLFHIGGLAMTVATLMVGGKTILTPRFDASEAASLMASERITFSVTFPPMLGAILDAWEGAAKTFPAVHRWCGVDNPDTIGRFLRLFPTASFISLYGQTEVMPVSGGNFRLRPGSIGKPALLTRVVLLDDDDQPVPAGETGEICVRSPAVFQGYWQRPADTTHTVRGGWHHTGDLGCLDEDGFLWYRGRKPEKELIKTGGENVYPAEVEKALLAHEAIAEACVIGVPDEQWGEAVKAICVLRQGYRVDAQELIAFVASSMARYKKPKYLVFVEELPKKPDGSPDRQKVKQLFGLP